MFSVHIVSRILFLLCVSVFKPPAKATKSFESLLIPQLPRSPPDVEAMRIYLILSECPALHDSKNYIRLTIPLAMAILRLDANPSKVLGTTFGRITAYFFPGR